MVTALAREASAEVVIARIHAQSGDRLRLTHPGAGLPVVRPLLLRPDARHVEQEVARHRDRERLVQSAQLGQLRAGGLVAAYLDAGAAQLLAQPLQARR